MHLKREEPNEQFFNRDASLPYQLRLKDFSLAMQDVYDFFYDVNRNLLARGLKRFDDFLRPAAMSGIISDMVTASLATHSRTLTENLYHNGHPDLILDGHFADNAAQSSEEGVEIKTTRKSGGGVDLHGARDQWMCVFVYTVDNETQPLINRSPMKFTEVYLARVVKDDFRKNSRGELGTRTASLHRDGLVKLRDGWIYLDRS